MDAEAGTPLLGAHSFGLRATFAAPLAALLGVVLALLAVFGEYSSELHDAHVARYYSFLTDVYCMIFLGFGMLMTFLRRYSLSAVALNMVLSAVVMLLALLCCGWAQQGWGTVAIDLPLLTDAAFAAGAAMISFGALLGKATPAQLLGVLALQAPLYAATAQLVAGRWAVLDVGGSITIHAFGAFYGLAASAFLSPPGGAGAGGAHPKNGASRASDLTAMLGTLFLFIYWPSFNSALASSDPGASAQQQQALAVLNTALALLGACCAAFAASPFCTPGGVLDMVHVQNATLAGGVAIGSAANLAIPPAAALGLGALAGALSVAGYAAASPALDRLGVTDTCGVLNLHGMPGALGGLASALFAALWGGRAANAPLIAHGARQPLVQLAGLGAALGAALAGGAAAGFAASKLDPAHQALTEGELFEDAPLWHLGEEEGKEE
ncbi:ammonium transporter Rh type A [Raphidocelis subcapitata]|uniref:Ammonium transporter Rh type A n=1 Tax=Raphidocelis subcapitata TaxID=307507 RepID=A0A2V0NYC0_9CHLO|nr:ammonium transporter Rh type A [Raphidocelis subcapitata]|eukprot:GBF90580.1 ammonium transporter Rh type A [Raphidocelis subcapitata]